MPARVKKIFHDEDTRAKIKVGNIITRMQSFALAHAKYTVDPENGSVTVAFENEDGKPVWLMTKEQIVAAKTLLDKALPNLTSVDVKEEKTTTYVLRAPSPAKDATEWLNTYGPKTINGIANPSPSGSPSPARKRLS